MKLRLSAIISILYPYRYWLVAIGGGILIGFVGENSIRKRLEYGLRVDELKEQIDKYNVRNEQDTKHLRDLQRTPKTIERIARERYFMKADDEDIFVLSDDEQLTNKQNETAQ